MKKFSALFLSFLAGVTLTVILSHSAYAFEIGARGYYWLPTLKSHLRVDGSSLQGTEFTLEDDLGLGKEAYPSVEVFGGLGKHHLSLMYTQATYSASTTLAQQIIFNGSTFPGGITVDSRFKLRMIDLAYQYDMIDLRNVLAGFSLGPIVKIKYVDGEASINSGGLGTSNDLRAPIPMLGLGGRIGILANILEARAEVTGIAYEKNYCYEGSADISVTPFPFVDIHGGYKLMKIHVDRNDVYFDSNIAGPYVALTIGF